MNDPAQPAPSDLAAIWCCDTCRAEGWQCPALCQRPCCAAHALAALREPCACGHVRFMHGDTAGDTGCRACQCWAWRSAPPSPTDDLCCNGEGCSRCTQPAPSDLAAAVARVLRWHSHLTTGQAWVRPTYQSGEPVPNAWIKADARSAHQTRYEWPISDAGPFIALSDSWALDKINREARRRDETEHAVHQLLRDHTAYRDPETSSWIIPPLEEAVARVYRHEQTARINADSRVRALRQAIAALIREPYDTLEVENPADQSVDAVEVVTVEALLRLLERDAEDPRP